VSWLEQKEVLDNLKSTASDIYQQLKSATDEERQDELREQYRLAMDKVQEQEELMRGAEL
jgi:hypothetical protein